MKAMLDSLKKAARAVTDRLKAWWARLQTKAAAAAAKTVVIVKHIWRDHKEPILWTLAWIAFGVLTTLGLAGVYYTSPAARFWLEEMALAFGKLVTRPFAWLKHHRPATPQTSAGTETAVAHSVTTLTSPAAPPPPPAESARPSRPIPVPPHMVKPPLPGGAVA